MDVDVEDVDEEDVDASAEARLELVRRSFVDDQALEAGCQEAMAKAVAEVDDMFDRPMEVDEGKNKAVDG